MRFAPQAGQQDCVGTPRKTGHAFAVDHHAPLLRHPIYASSEILARLAGLAKKTAGASQSGRGTTGVIDQSRRGRGARATGSGGVKPAGRRPPATASEHALSAPRWGWTTPFGLPVVPEEYITQNSSFGVQVNTPGAVSAMPCITAEALRAHVFAIAHADQTQATGIDQRHHPFKAGNHSANNRLGAAGLQRIAPVPLSFSTRSRTPPPHGRGTAKG